MNNPNFEEVCKAMGCHSCKIITHDQDQLEKELKYVIDYEDGPIVCNVITDENEVVLPMVSPGKPLDDMIIDEIDTNKYSGDAPC
jgi:acetolactate synthase-1/2/3 large subunit